MKTVELIKKVTANGRTFLITKDENGYWGIEDKYYRNGKLTRSFNGIQGNLTDSLEKTEKNVRIRIEVDRLKDSGMDLLDAIPQAYINLGIDF